MKRFNAKLFGLATNYDVENCFINIPQVYWIINKEFTMSSFGVVEIEF